jgi:hypothetical protein
VKGVKLKVLDVDALVDGHEKSFAQFESIILKAHPAGPKP